MRLEQFYKKYDSAWRKFEGNPKKAAAVTFGLAAAVATAPNPLIPETARALIVGGLVAVGTLYFIEAVVEGSSQRYSDTQDADMLPHRPDRSASNQAQGVMPTES